MEDVYRVAFFSNMDHHFIEIFFVFYLVLWHPLVSGYRQLGVFQGLRVVTLMKPVVNAFCRIGTSGWINP